MSTRGNTDSELLDLIRNADPMRDSRVQANAGLDTESALRRLAPELDRPALQRTPHRRRRALRTVVLAVAVAATVFVVANVASTGSGSAISPAQAMILRHVRDALAWPPHTIYEEDSVTTSTRRNGATHTVEYHEWLSTSPPYNSRLMVVVNGKVLWEQAFVSGRLDVYDPTTNTIYLAPGVASRDVVGCQRCSGDTPQSNSALSEIQYLLNQPHATINKHAVLNGKPAIKLTFDRGRFSYWISPHTYQPLQATDSFFPGVSRFPIARVLSKTQASASLLSLQAQHPSATVDHRGTDYKTAQRLVRVRGAQTGR
ncbi:MAG: hypothetical protein ABI355_04510 [Solirubrobacteraceae bacterium]